MSYETLDWRVTDAILTLTLARPDKLNAFTVTMANELIDAFDRASRDDGVRAIVVTGAGRTFSVGMDLSEASATGNVFGLDETLDPTLDELLAAPNDPALLHGVRDTGGRVSLAIYNCTKPVIGAANGLAVGVGATMQLPMDVRLASSEARYGFVFGKVGIVPEACSTWFLPRIVGLSKALEWTYSAEIFGAAEAQAHGLVSEVLAPDELLPRAYELADKFSRNRSRTSTALTRQMMYRNAAEPSPWRPHMIESLAVLHTSRVAGKEGIAAFLEKRMPDFARHETPQPPFVPWWSDMDE